MSNDNTGLQLRSLIRKSGELELSLTRVAIADPGPGEVVVRVEASPINPSDLGLLFGTADMRTAQASGTSDLPIVTATVPEKLMKVMAARIDNSMAVGNEGAGVVVKAGAAPTAQALLNKTVALMGGAMYSQYRTVQAAQCLVLPSGTTAAQGASCFINPLTALSMTEVMRREGHTALVHTAAASNLGQMLNRICLKDGIALVNIVRRPEQENSLRDLGAQYICNSTAPTFVQDLTRVLVTTGATLAFDAIGGGKLAGQILSCMEAALNQATTQYSRYGSAVHKQVYVYGSLDRQPIELARDYGLAWGVGGWLVTAFLQKIGHAQSQAMRDRVVAELKTTFASHYTREISLIGALQLETIAAYGKLGTGEKYLINPHKTA